MKTETNTKNMIFRLMIVQLAIFGLAIPVSYFINVAYATVLIFSGIGIGLFFLPWNFELQSYTETSKVMMHHAHHQTLKQMSDGQKHRYGDVFYTLLYSFIPFIAGVLLSIVLA